MTQPQLRLFDEDTGRVEPAPVGAELRAVAALLPPGLRLGTSSWTYPGWTGAVYASPDPPSSAAGRAASARLPTPAELAFDGLAAYARHPLLGAVGIDRSYYAPVPREVFARYAALVPESFRFLVKADRALVMPLGDDGAPNPRFLDAGHALDAVVVPALEGLRGKAGAIVVQFPPLTLSLLGGALPFLESLRRFLAAVVPACGSVPVAVELRNADLLRPRTAAALADALGGTGARYAYALHPKAAELGRQLEVFPVEGQPEVVVRWMLRRNHRYEEAAEIYRPFDRLVEPDVLSRRAVSALVRSAAALERSTYVIANNKAEGSAPQTLLELAREVAACGSP